MTVFISALPISTLLAFIYNCFEIKLDAWKLLKVNLLFSYIFPIFVFVFVLK